MDPKIAVRLLRRPLVAAWYYSRIAQISLEVKMNEIYHLQFKVELYDCEVIPSDIWEYSLVPGFALHTGILNSNVHNKLT